MKQKKKKKEQRTERTENYDVTNLNRSLQTDVIDRRK